MIYTIYLDTLGACFLCSLISFRLHYPIHLKLFSLSLGLGLVTEILAVYVIKHYHLSNNYLIYSSYMLVEYCLYAVYFKFIIHGSKARQFISAFLMAFPVVWIITTFYIFHKNGWNSYVVLFGDAFTIAMCIVYFREVFISDQLIDFKVSPEFWIAAALLIFSCCELPITGILNYLAVKYQKEALLLEDVLQLLNIFMYLIIIYAYLCRLLTNTTKYL